MSEFNDLFDQAKTGTFSEDITTEKTTNLKSVLGDQKDGENDSFMIDDMPPSPEPVPQNTGDQNGQQQPNNGNPIVQPKTYQVTGNIINEEIAVQILNKLQASGNVYAFKWMNKILVSPKEFEFTKGEEKMLEPAVAGMLAELKIDLTSPTLAFFSQFAAITLAKHTYLIQKMEAEIKEHKEKIANGEIPSTAKKQRKPGSGRPRKA